MANTNSSEIPNILGAIRITIRQQEGKHVRGESRWSQTVFLTGCRVKYLIFANFTKIIHFMKPGFGALPEEACASEGPCRLNFVKFMVSLLLSKCYCRPG